MRTLILRKRLDPLKAESVRSIDENSMLTRQKQELGS